MCMEKSYYENSKMNILTKWIFKVTIFKFCKSCCKLHEIFLQVEQNSSWIWVSLIFSKAYLISFILIISPSEYNEYNKSDLFKPSEHKNNSKTTIYYLWVNRKFLRVFPFKFIFIEKYKSQLKFIFMMPSSIRIYISHSLLNSPYGSFRVQKSVNLLYKVFQNPLVI